ncbi:MAG: esterase, partial [Comamonadaceae bacterium]
MTYFRLTCVAAAAALLVACGGSDDPDRGALIDPPAVLTTLTAAQIDAGTNSTGLQAISGKAKCDVKVVSLNYATVGAKAGENTNASGVMLVPAGSCAAAAAPLIAYAKGTDVQKPRTLANPQDSETFLLAAMYAAQGYAVVA